MGRTERGGSVREKRGIRQCGVSMRERGGDDCIHGTLCLADGWMDGRM